MNLKLQALRSLLIDPSSNYVAVAAALAAVVVLVLIFVFAAVALILPGKRTSEGARPMHVGARALIAGLVVLGLALATSIWYQTTSSDEYCATTCHAMARSATSWAKSPHGSVSCVRCHEGSGVAALPETVSSRVMDLYLNAFGLKSSSRSVPADRCLDCHSTVLDMPLTARNGESFLHRDVLSDGTPCVSCHGDQGHVPARR